METDEILFQRVRRGDVEAFDRLYERYEANLFGYLRALLGNRQDAEEVFHDAFLKALEASVASFQAGGFRAWLYRVARNLALNRVRAAGRRDRAHAAAGADGDGTWERTGAAPADAAIEASELATALGRAVGRLPPALGEVYHLRASGLSYEEIASLVEVPLGTVKSRMHHMVQTLREELKPWIAPK